MANGVVGTSVELTGEVTKTVVRGGTNVVRGLGESAVRRIWPGLYIPPKIMAQQAVLREFEGRLAMAGDLMDPNDSLRDEDELEARASSTAQALVEVGVADPETTVELRPVLPGDALRDSALNTRREKVVRFLRHALAHDHDITAIPNTHPIIPSEHKASTVDPAAAWGAISAELDLFSHQLGMDRTVQRRPAMLAITGTPYSQAILETQAGRSQHLEHYGLVVLQRVGTLPEDNILVPAG